MLSKVFIAIPNMGWVASGMLPVLIYWLREFGVRLYAPSGLRPIPHARNTCVQAFLESDCTHLWFVDADTIPPLDALAKLLEPDVDAIAGLYHVMQRDTDGRQKPAPMLLRHDQNGDLKAAYGQGVERVDSCASGCSMFRRSVFETLSFPWYEERTFGAVRGSDLILCEKLAEADIPLWGHFGVVCLHRKEVEY